MTSPAMPFGQPHREDVDLRALTLPTQPAEGWLTVFLVAVMAASIAWSIDDARWIFGRQGLTPFLVPSALLGCAYGFASAKARWSRLVALPVGALLAAVMLPVMIGGVLAPTLGPVGQFGAAASSVVKAYVDVVRRGQATTPEYAQWLLVFGALAWGTGWFIAWTTFHHRRPVNAVLLAGAVLVTSMSLTISDQFGVLVIFSVSALLLLIRMHAFEERSTWLRHQVWRAGTMGAPYLRGGLLFVAVAVGGAIVLTATASSAPLAGAFVEINDRLIDFGRQFQGILPQGGPGSRIIGTSFGPSLTITGTWQTDASPVLQIQVPDNGVYHWRAITYDRFTGSGWTQTNTARRGITAGLKALAGTTEGSLGVKGRHDVTFEVRPLDAIRLVVSPNQLVSVDQPTHLTTVNEAGSTFFASLTTDRTGSYQVIASVAQIDPTGAQGLTANQLRAAGQAYPADLEAAYTQILPGTVGAETRALLSTILSSSGATGPYDVAKAIESYLRSPDNFHYDTNVADIDCGGRSVVDCFVFSRRGYCEHYASLMTMLLRLDGIPARMVEGYLPSTPDATGLETILRDQAHAWVEVYFPGYGWIEFDPTGQVGVREDLPPGPSVAPATPGPSAGPSASGGGVPRRPGEDRATQNPGTGGGGTSGGDNGSTGLIAVALLLGAALVAAVTFAYRRAERALPDPQSVYRGVTGLARRLGYGPRPTQTVYEYIGALSDLVPVARPELQTVAAAKVEVAYGRRELGEDRLRALRDARRRLRVSLLRLVLRRRPGRGPGTGPPSR